MTTASLTLSGSHSCPSLTPPPCPPRWPTISPPLTAGHCRPLRLRRARPRRGHRPCRHRGHRQVARPRRNPLPAALRHPGRPKLWRPHCGDLYGLRHLPGQPCHPAPAIRPRRRQDRQPCHALACPVPARRSPPPRAPVHIRSKTGTNRERIERAAGMRLCSPQALGVCGPFTHKRPAPGPRPHRKGREPLHLHCQRMKIGPFGLTMNGPLSQIFPANAAR